MLKNKKNNKDKSAKSRNKRILSIYSSQNSHLQILPKSTTVVLKKATKTSVPNLNSQQKQQPKKQKSRQHTIVMKKPPVENYERIPLYFVNSDTNSEIQFSNLGETKKQSNKYCKDWRIACGHQAILKQIWGNKKGGKKVDKRKKSPEVQNKAATKIQKVFRGYLTRKLLMKYVQQYEQKLLIEKERLKNQIKTRKNQLSLFPSRKQSNKIQYSPNSEHEDVEYELLDPEQRQNPLEMQSSIMVADEQIGNSQFVEEDPLHNASHQTYEIPQQELQSDRIYQQQYQLSRQQEISLSFGHENQNSPHFLKIAKKRNSKEISKSSFEQQPRKKHYISDDKTGQGFSQNISSCPSHSKNNRVQRQLSSHKSSLMRQQQNEHLTQRDLAYFENLRSVEKSKWQQVISLVNSQMKEGINQQKTRELMSLILQFSLKNREELSHKIPEQIAPTTSIIIKQEDIEQQAYQQKQAFKKKKWNEGEQYQEKIKRNQNMPLARRPKQDKSLLERTSNMKEYFLKNLRIQDSQVDQMMQVRQAVLRKKQGKSLQQLNDLLQNHDLSQDDFIDRMGLLTSRFIRYKNQIEQTKNQIYQGYKAQVELFKQTILDAKSLGYQVPFCRSMEIYPNYSQWRFDDVMIDELNHHSQRRSKKVYITDGQINNKISKEFMRSPKIVIEQIKAEKVNEQRQMFQKSVSESQEEDSANFSYEQTNIYNNYPPISKKGQEDGENEAILSPKNLKKANIFSRFSSVPFCQFGQFEGAEKKLHNSQQKQNHQEQEQQYLSLKRMPKKQTFKIQFSSDQQQQLILYHQSSDKKVEELTNIFFNKVVFQTLEDLFKSDKILQSLNIHNKAARKILQPICKQQRLSFLSHCLKFIPSFVQVQNRLNQKMYPNTKQLLISMRQNIDQLQSDHEYYEIGHYQYILNQQTCFQMIDAYIEAHKAINTPKQDHIQKMQLIKQQIQQYSSAKLKKYLQNYGYNSQIKRREAFELRQQVLKIELHLMLDVWNEQLIKYRENKVGYSGIGLNEITFSLINRVCRPIRRQDQWIEMICKTKESIESTVKSQNLNTRLIAQYEQFVSKNDSQWIYYSQQGLQFGFDLTKVLEVQLIFELLEQLHLINDGRDTIIEQSSNSEESKQSSLRNNFNLKPEEQNYFEDSQNQLSNEEQLDDYFGEQQLQLNEDEQHILEQKMKQMETINVDHESEDSFDD